MQVMQSLKSQGFILWGEDQGISCMHGRHSGQRMALGESLVLVQRVDPLGTM